jgi:Fe-S oxidoreductase
VIGAGISGLACALRLASKKYAVDVYERSGRVGGALWNVLDSAVFLEDIRLQFSNEEYGLFLDHPVLDIGPLLEKYDGVYIATGSGGDSFGLGREAGPDEGIPFATSLPGVFLGGSLTGATLMEALSQGLKASLCIEDFLKTGEMRSAKKNNPTRMRLAPGAIVFTHAVLPASGEQYSKEEAAAEASRCIRCRCDACIRHCGLMSYFKKFPGRIAEEVQITVTPGTLDGDGTVATRLIATCSQCGLCGEVCPENIDMGEFLRAGHQAMHEKGAMPWAFHEFWLRDMAFANSSRASFSAPPPSGEKCTSVFFPGCQLGASDPRYVSESFRFLLGLEPGTGLTIGCCGAPALWAGDMALFRKVCETLLEIWRQAGCPRMILACPTCLEMFSRYLPEIDCVLLYDVLARGGTSVPGAGRWNGGLRLRPLCRQEPGNVTAGGAVPSSGSGLQPRRSSLRGQNRPVLLLRGADQIAAPKYSRWLAEKRSKDGEHPYIVYCSNCRDVFLQAGKPVRHILDVFFGLNGESAGPPAYDERRKRREKLKEDLVRKYWPELEEPGKEGAMDSRNVLTIPPDVREKMNGDRLLEEDALAVIEQCEASGRRVLDPATGHCLGYGEIGYMTQWVEYAPSPEGYVLFNTYAHRMKIELE